MKVLVQRVSEASCTVENKLVSKISNGLLLFLGIKESDSEIDVINLAKKVVNLRIFPNDKGKFDKSILDFNYEILNISQFTLYADCQNGNRPSFTDAMNPNDAFKLYKLFTLELEKFGIVVKEGIFGEHMLINLTNDGPVTILLET